MDTTTPLIDTERNDDTIILIPKRDLRELEFEQIQAAMSRVLEWIELAQVKHVVIDFCNTDYYGSTALAFFTKLWKRIKTRGGHLAFCNVSPHEREILEITHLGTLWSICDSREKAIEAVQKS